MKHYIALLLIALLTVSCSKEERQANKLLGLWELTKINEAPASLEEQHTLYFVAYETPSPAAFPLIKTYLNGEVDSLQFKIRSPRNELDIIYPINDSTSLILIHQIERLTKQNLTLTHTNNLGNELTYAYVKLKID